MQHPTIFSVKSLAQDSKVKLNDACLYYWYFTGGAALEM